MPGGALTNTTTNVTVQSLKSGTNYIWSHFDSGCGNVFGCDYSYEAYYPNALRQSTPTTVQVSSSYAPVTTIGVDPDKLAEATQAASALSDVGASLVLPKAGLSPVFGKTSITDVPVADNGIPAVSQAMLEGLAANGIKFTAQNAVATAQTSAGKIVFMETGNVKLGLIHIIAEHTNDFANIGVRQDQIPVVILQAVTQGTIVGYQGAGTGRPIFETLVNGKPQLIAVTIADNGYIVGANPRSTAK